MKVAYLGPAGTYSEQVARAMYADKPAVDFWPVPTIADAIWAVHGSKADACVVPIENSLEGSVNITADLLAHEVTGLHITGEMALPVKHCLFAAPGTTDIKLVMSHPQALGQCRRYLDEHYPAAVRRPVDSTAQALELVSQGTPGQAAIGNLQAGALYKLQLIDCDIQDYTENHTRFVRVERQSYRASSNSGKYKTSIILLMHGNQPGGLCDILHEFAVRGVNLTRIESRPARIGLGTYVFFLDMEGSIEDGPLREALKATEERSEWVKFLGSYPVLTYVEENLQRE